MILDLSYNPSLAPAGEGDSAKALTLRLGGKWQTNYGVAPCPVCQPEARHGQDALTISNGREKLLAHCKKSACHIRDILVAAGIQPGNFAPPDSSIMAQRRAEDKRQAQRKASQAKVCWGEALPICGTLAEAYLRGRSITCEIPASLRFHPDCWHGASAKRLPAMVAAVSRLRGSGAPAIHRSYLRANGIGKASVTPAKMMLGCTSGGCVKLSECAGPLVVCEGIETGLSLLSGLLAAPATVVAALSTSGVNSLALPAEPDTMIIASDGDSPGRAAAHALATRAKNLGWHVQLLPAPDGADWNDVLRENV